MHCVVGDIRRYATRAIGAVSGAGPKRDTVTRTNRTGDDKGKILGHLNFDAAGDVPNRIRFVFSVSPGAWNRLAAPTAAIFQPRL